MLAYAVNRPFAARRQSSPQVLLLIISVHIAVIAAVMGARNGLPRTIDRPPPLINIPLAPPAPAFAHPHRSTTAKPRRTLPPLDSRRPPIAIPRLETPTLPVDATPLNEPLATVQAPPVSSQSLPLPPKAPAREPRLLTAPAELKPRYPASKLASEQEATLTLRLAIDERGHVVTVEPTGYADAAFLDAARRHIIAHWRYEPAIADGHTVAAVIFVTLRFELDN